MDVSGPWRSTKVEDMVKIVGGCHLGKLSQMPVGVQDMSLSSLASCPDTSIWGGCGGEGVGCLAAFPHHCCLSLLSQDASGAGPGESAGLGPSPLPSVSAVTLGAEPGSGHSDHPAFPSLVGSSLPPCVLSSSAISLPLSQLPFPGALLVSDSAAPGVGTGPACSVGVLSAQGETLSCPQRP